MTAAKNTNKTAEPRVKRRRRTSEQAKLEILDAAERIMLRDGPGDLKFPRIAAEANLSMSNAHHHFGGIQGIQSALVERMLSALIDDLSGVYQNNAQPADAISAPADTTSPEKQAKEALHAVYRVVSSEHHAKLVAWILLSPKTANVVSFFEPIRTIRTMVLEKLSERMSPDSAAKLAPVLIYRVAITGIGEGLAGALLRQTLNLDISAQEIPNDLTSLLYAR